MRVRVGAAVVFVGLVTLAIYVVPSDWGDRHEALATCGVVGLYLLTGALVGRWWALLLPFVPVLLQLPLGAQRSTTPAADRGSATHQRRRMVLPVIGRHVIS